MGQTADHTIGRVLSIAGSDSSGGAGIQADIKTISALGGYAMTAITALTAQNTKGIEAVLPVEPDFLEAQIRLCLEDIGADAIKIGMLPTAACVERVCQVLDEMAAGIPVVTDTVLSASTGVDLATGSAFEALKDKLVRRSTVITPNIPEAERLAGMKILSLDGMKTVAVALLELGAPHVLLTGGHLDGDVLHDVLAHASGFEVFTADRLDSTSTHGTGCTLSSALATGLSFGMPVSEAVSQAQSFVRDAIAHAQGLGTGRGPLNHQFKVSRP